MIGLQWRTGRQRNKPPRAIVISRGPSTPQVERSAPPYDPFAAYGLTMTPPKRKRGRPRKS